MPFQDSAGQIPLSRYLMISLIAILIITIGAFSAFSYFEAKEDLFEKNNALMEESEDSIVQSAILVDKGLQLFDATFDAKMEQGFDAFVAEYERCRGDPAQMDLASLKAQLDAEYEGSFDLYVIDAKGVVKYTTCEMDRNLDFKQWPEVYRSITRIREGDAFSADRIVHGFNPTAELRKFAYMPTKDHRYLLELSLTSESFKAQRKAFSYAQISRDLVRLNPNLVSIVFYDSTGRKTTESYEIEGEEEDQEVNTFITKLYEDKTTREVYDEEEEILVRYVYIDLSEGECVSSSQMSLVAQLTYDVGMQNAEIHNLFTSHLAITILAIAMGVFVAYGSSRYISRPINEIVEDTTIIAGGDLDHSIRPTMGMEFGKLEQSINIMVARLKDTIRKQKESEDRIKEYTGHLEEMVAERTAELQKSNDEMSIYLNILSHDVHLSHGVTVSYLELLKKSLSGNNRQLAVQALEEMGKSTDVIRNVDIIRRIYSEERAMVPVALDDAIDRVILNHPDVAIRTTPGGVYVLADDHLVEALDAVIGMIAGHAGAEVTIDIASRQMDRFCEVSVSGSGPGLRESMPDHPFDRFGTGRMRPSAGALGPYIAWLLVERYGGSIRAEEGIHGGAERSVTVIFTLRTAHYGPDGGDDNPDRG